MLDGYGQLKDYFQRAEELGLAAIGISDHGNLHHIIDAYEVSKDYDIKYVPSIELYQARQTRWHKDELERASGKASDEFGGQRGPYHLSAIARTKHGFKNLVKLSSDSFTEGWYGKNRIDHELLAKYGDGLIIISGCLSGEINQALLRDDYNGAVKAAARMQDFVGKDNFYIEVMDHGISEEAKVLPLLVKIAGAVNAKIIPTIDSHYVRKEDYLGHDLSLCLGTGSLRSDENRFKFHNDEFYLKSYAEMSKLFPAEWLKNTLELTERVENPDFELKEFQFPIYDYDGDHYEYLRDLTYKGLKTRYGEITHELEERVEYELGVILRMGFVDYILIVWDIINFCHSNGIIASARGSAAGSIVVYALGVTAVDPIKFKLAFERFLIEGRISMPDVDVDVAEDRREEVVNYIRTKYGTDRVSNICNFTAIGAKAAIRDAARILGYEYALGDKLANLVPPPVQGFSKSLEETFEESEAIVEEYNNNPQAKEVLDAAKGLEGLIRQTGVHAAGILITPGPLNDYVPIMQKPNKDGSDGPIVSQWNGKQVESQGLLKVDILGLKNYTIIDKTLKSIKDIHNIDLKMENLPLDDPKTFELLRSGDTSTVFQLGNSGISNLVYDIQPDKLEDIMAIQALYRPGPLGSRMDKAYVARKRGTEKVTFMHPLLKEALIDTLGLMVFQEDILSIARILAGYSVPERDALRRLVGKKEKDKIPKARAEFVKRCVSHAKMSESLANNIFDQIERFGAYGFPRPHASSYSFIAFQTAYLKAHYPTEYMAAVISSQDNIEKAGEHVENTKKLGIDIIGPSINTSGRDFTVVDQNTIQYGLSTIAGLGAATLDRILDSERNFNNIYEWLRKSDPEVLNKGIIEHLLYSGALDELAPEQEERAFKRQERINILTAEGKELGSFVTEHPLQGIWTFLEHDISHTIAEVSHLLDRASVALCGIIISKEVKYTKKDNKMFLIFNIQDMTGSIEVMVFAKQAAAFQNLEVGDIAVMSGAITHERKLIGEEEAKKSRLTAFDFKIPQLPELAVGQTIQLFFNNKPSPVTLQKIHDIIEYTPGDSYVTIAYPADNLNLSYKFKKPTSKKVKEQLEMITLTENQLNIMGDN